MLRTYSSLIASASGTFGTLISGLSQSQAKFGTFVMNLTPLPAASFHLSSCVRWTFSSTSLRRSIPSALPGFRIVPAVEQGTPIFINRDLPRSGYWDHPVSRVRPDEIELDLLRFFDFDQLGYRDYRYFEVMVHGSTHYPDIIGRAALIEVEHARVLFSKIGA